MNKLFRQDILNLLVSIASKLPDLEFQSSGGYLCLVETDEKGDLVGTPEFYLGGEPPKEKKFGRAKSALEKTLRIIEFFLKHSFERRSVQKKQYGGGIRYHKFVCAFSGFPELVDEAISIIFIVFIRTIPQDKETFGKRFEQELKTHKHYEKNPYIRPILKEFLTKI